MLELVVTPDSNFLTQTAALSFYSLYFLDNVVFGFIVNRITVETQLAM